ncbi:MAG: hypothetical protein U9O87_00875, partial [Verrucomicrobiota bacterium]|nr:hypothetical protein [Verrucomicrobiota bacterium]
LAPVGHGWDRFTGFYVPYCGLTMLKAQAGYYTKNHSILMCPSDSDFILKWGEDLMSYGSNYKLGDSSDTWRKMHSFSKPSLCMMISESDNEVIHPNFRSAMDYNHMNKNNVAYLDGSASRLTYINWVYMHDNKNLTIIANNFWYGNPDGN